MYLLTTRVVLDCYLYVITDISNTTGSHLSKKQISEDFTETETAAFRRHDGGTVSTVGLRKSRANIMLKQLFSSRRLILTEIKFSHFNGFCIKYI